MIFRTEHIKSGDAVNLGDRLRCNASNEGPGTIYVYHGASMYPTLRRGDILVVEPRPEKALRRGDTIVFGKFGRPQAVVHRIVDFCNEFVITRGDNNATCDSETVSYAEIVGVVTTVERSGKRARLRGGRVGQILGWNMRVRRTLTSEIAALIRPLYRRLARSSVLRGFRTRLVNPRVIAYRSGGGSELHVYCGSRLAGRLPEGADAWLIYPPYRLLLDEDALPVTHGHHGVDTGIARDRDES